MEPLPPSPDPKSPGTAPTTGEGPICRVSGLRGPWFGHAGDAGDILYALPAIRAAGGGTLVLFDQPGLTSHGMDPHKAASLTSLIARQPYIGGVVYADRPYPHPLNRFRDHPGETLVDQHLAALGLADPQLRYRRWIDPVAPAAVAPVVFHRSPRYQNPLFPWAQAMERYGREAAFVGSRAEHAAFEAEWGAIPYCATRDYYELARVIAGAKLFIGNQSSPAAVAEGMKHPMILEVSVELPNCCVRRLGRVNGYNATIEWPDL